MSESEEIKSKILELENTLLKLQVRERKEDTIQEELLDERIKTNKILSAILYTLFLIVFLLFLGL